MVVAHHLNGPRYALLDTEDYEGDMKLSEMTPIIIRVCLRSYIKGWRYHSCTGHVIQPNHNRNAQTFVWGWYNGTDENWGAYKRCKYQNRHENLIEARLLRWYADHKAYPPELLLLSDETVSIRRLQYPISWLPRRWILTAGEMRQCMLSGTHPFVWMTGRPRLAREYRWLYTECSTCITMFCGTVHVTLSRPCWSTRESLLYHTALWKFCSPHTANDSYNLVGNIHSCSVQRTRKHYQNERSLFPTTIHSSLSVDILALLPNEVGKSNCEELCSPLDLVYNDQGHTSHDSNLDERCNRFEGYLGYPVRDSGLVAAQRWFLNRVKVLHGSQCLSGNHSWSMLGSGCGANYLTCTDCSGLSLYKHPFRWIWIIKNDHNSVCSSDTIFPVRNTGLTSGRQCFKCRRLCSWNQGL